jgi:ribonuclease P protein component
VRLNTLKTRRAFQRVRAGKTWKARAFVLQALARPSPDGSAPCFGFAVSSRALTAEPKVKGEKPKRPGAVKRNRARRRLKEAVRLTAPHCAKPDFDYVIIGRREALHQGFADLLEDMQLAFEKVHRPPRKEEAGAAPGRKPERAAVADQRKVEEF